MTPFEYSHAVKELVSVCTEAHFHWGRIYRLANKRFKIQSYSKGWQNSEEYISLIEAFKAVPAEIKATIELNIQHS